MAPGRVAIAAPRVVGKAKVGDVRPYDLRKLAAVRAYDATGNKLKATCRFSGHADAVTLLRHYLFDEDDAITLAVRGEGGRADAACGDQRQGGDK